MEHVFPFLRYLSLLSAIAFSTPIQDHVSVDEFIIPGNASAYNSVSATNLTLSTSLNTSRLATPSYSNQTTSEIEAAVPLYCNGTRLGYPDPLSCLDALRQIPKGNGHMTVGQRGSGARLLFPHRWLSCELRIYFVSLHILLSRLLLYYPPSRLTFERGAANGRCAVDLLQVPRPTARIDFITYDLIANAAGAVLQRCLLDQGGQGGAAYNVGGFRIQ